MKAKWIISLFVALLAVYTVWDYRKAQRAGAFAADERAPFSIPQDEIDLIKVERGEDSIELRKGDDRFWKMTKPVEDDVEDASVMSLLLSLTTQRVRLFNPEDEAHIKPDWSKFGLDPAVATFVVGAGRKQETLSVSNKNAFDGSFYLRQKDELLVGDQGFAQLTGRSSNTLRSRLLWREKAPVEQASVELENEKYLILKKDGRWTIEPPPAYALDLAKIESWLERVQEFKPAELVKDGLSEEDKRTYLVLVPSAKIRLNDDWLLTIGQDRAEDVFLYTNKRDTLFKTSAPVLAQLRVGRQYFRDGRKAFEFPVEQAHSIEVRSGKTAAVLKKTATGWAGDKGQDLSAEAVAFMQALKSLEARDFPAAPKKTGIASPQVLVKNEKGEELLALAWGDDFKPAALKYARTNLEKDLLGIEKKKLESLMKALTPKPASHHHHDHPEHE